MKFLVVSVKVAINFLGKSDKKIIKIDICGHFFVFLEELKKNALIAFWQSTSHAG